LSFSLQGALKNPAKEEKTMSNENTIHKHELHVVFEEDENAVITWNVAADERVEQTLNESCEELTEAGAPLAALGIKVLRQLLAEQIIDLALNKADNYRWRNLFQRIQGATEDEPEQLEEPKLQVIH